MSCDFRNSMLNRVSMFWDEVGQIRSIAEVEGAVSLRKKEYPSLVAAQRTVFENSIAESEFVQRVLLPFKYKGTVLDLGCGVGANAVLLAKSGWKVIALDRDKKLLEMCHKAILDLPNLEHFPEMIEGDMTHCELPQGVDVVVCTDVLPYIAPQKIKAVMGRIHQALNPEGVFIGSLLFTKEASRDHEWRNFTKDLGAHVYPTREMALNLISYSGFDLKRSFGTLIRGEEKGIEFLATRSVDNLFIE